MAAIRRSAEGPARLQASRARAGPSPGASKASTVSGPGPLSSSSRSNRRGKGAVPNQECVGSTRSPTAHGATWAEAFSETTISPVAVIEVQDLVKTFGFRGTTTALDHVTFSVPDRARFGLLGASASGKSSALRILSTSLRPTSGSARVGGHDIVEEPDEVRKQIGYMPQDAERRAWSTGRDYLRFWARMCGLSAEAPRERIDHVAGFP